MHIPDVFIFIVIYGSTSLIVLVRDLMDLKPSAGKDQFRNTYFL